MASHSNTLVKDEHLREAVLDSFYHSEEAIDSVKNALLDQSKRASRGDQRLFLAKLHERFTFVQDYWNQLRDDYVEGINKPKSNVKTFIEVVRDAGFNHGYKKGLAEGHNGAFNDGFAEGFEEGCTKAPTPFKHGAIGFMIAIALVFIFRQYIPTF